MLRLITTAFAAAFVLAATGLASAADINKAPARDAYAAAGPTFGGFYIGPSIGYTFGEVKTEDFKLKPDGFAGGGHAGVNFQSGTLVAGLEVDLMMMNITGRWTEGGTCAVSKSCDTVASKYDMIATARARLGLTVLNGSTLIYGTGGIAWARGTVDSVDSSVSGIIPPKVTSVAESFGFNSTGWTVGGGVEVILSQHWTWRSQYLYVDLGKTGDAKNVVNIATTGLSFRF